MYLKLALRNAKRSAVDYLLYSFTVTILVSIICMANCMAALGKIAAGLQTASLPLLIVLIMVVLVDYINQFMVRQRAKELATYLLLGMEKRKLSLMFFIELSVIGAVCFALGVVLASGVYCLFFGSIRASVMANSILRTFLYFCIVELLSMLRMRRNLLRLEIHQLMQERRRNRPHSAGKANHWGVWLIANLTAFLAVLGGVAFLPDNQGLVLISIVAIPMLGSIFTFYRWIYAYLSAKRIACSQELYRGTRLYHIAELTSHGKTGATMNSIFCSCLLFSATAFVCGAVMLTPHISVFAPDEQRWMGFLQISICILFMVIYFSILSLLQIVELRQQAAGLRLLHYMGKNASEIKALVRSQIFIKLSLPTWMCFVLLGFAAPLVSIKLKTFLPPTAHNLLPLALGGFIACFMVLYLVYFVVVYTVGGRYSKSTVAPEQS